MLSFLYELFLTLFVSYFLGCVNAAYYFAHIVYHVDIRDFGSGNAGTTNVQRVFGVKAAVFVFCFDVLKASVAVLVAQRITDNPIVLSAAAIAVVCGHILPLFLDFKGGKGIAASIGIMLVYCPLACAVAVGVAIILIAFSRYVSLGSITGISIAPLSLLAFHAPLYQIITMAVLAVITIYQHRGNILRIKNKTENKFHFKKTQG